MRALALVLLAAGCNSAVRGDPDVMKSQPPEAPIEKHVAFFLDPGVEKVWLEIGYVHDSWPFGPASAPAIREELKRGFTAANGLQKDPRGGPTSDTYDLVIVVERLIGDVRDHAGMDREITLAITFGLYDSLMQRKGEIVQETAVRMGVADLKLREGTIDRMARALTFRMLRELAGRK